MASIINADTSNGLKLTSDTSGVVEIQSAGTKVAEINASGVLSANSGYGSVAPIYGVRAWVNFNGTGTVAIRGSGNVSSITDNGAGDYDVNLTTAMSDTNGSIGACAAETAGSNTGGLRVISASFSSTTVIKVSALYQNGGVADPQFVGVQVFR